MNIKSTAKKPNQSTTCPQVRKKTTFLSQQSSLMRDTSNMLVAYPDSEPESNFKTTKEIQAPPEEPYMPPMGQNFQIVDNFSGFNQTLLNNASPDLDMGENTFKNNFYHFYMGMLSLSILFTILSGNDLISKKFPDYKYNFFSVFPAHIAVVFSILLIPVLSNKYFNTNSRIIVSLLTASVFGDLMVIIIYFYPNDIFGILLKKILKR